MPSVTFSNNSIFYNKSDNSLLLKEIISFSFAKFTCVCVCNRNMDI